MEYILTLVVEEYGPIGVFLLFLYRQQKKHNDAIITLAEEQPGVDENRVRDKIAIVGGGNADD